MDRADKGRKETKAEATRRRTSASYSAGMVLIKYSCMNPDRWTLPSEKVNAAIEVLISQNQTIGDADVASITSRLNDASQILLMNLENEADAKEALTKFVAISDASAQLCQAWGALSDDLKLTIKYQISQGAIVPDRKKSLGDIIEGDEYFRRIDSLLGGDLWRLVTEIGPLASALKQYKGKKSPFATGFVATLCTIWLEYTGNAPAFTNAKDGDSEEPTVRTPFERFVAAVKPLNCDVTDHVVRETVETFGSGKGRRKTPPTSP